MPTKSTTTKSPPNKTGNKSSRPRKSDQPGYVETRGGYRPNAGKALPNVVMKTIEQDDEKRAFMAKAVYNAHQFFKVGLNPVKSEEELADRLNYFFDVCANTQQLPTVEKMCLCIGYTTQEVLNWTNGAPYKWVTEECRLIIKKAKNLIASMDAELAQEGKIQPVVYMFRAKNYYGMKDQQEVVVTPNGQQEYSPEDLVAEAKMLAESKQKEKSRELLNAPPPTENE